jgi:hypothetical protein
MSTSLMVGASAAGPALHRGGAGHGTDHGQRAGRDQSAPPSRAAMCHCCSDGRHCEEIQVEGPGARLNLQGVCRVNLPGPI